MSSSVANKNVKSTSKTKTPRSSPSQLKVVVRRLPFQMKEEEFVTAIVAAAAEAGIGERGVSWDFMYFTPGKMSKKRGRVTGTGYLHIDRGRGASADLSLMKLRAAVLACGVLAPGGAGSGSSAPSGDKKQSSGTSYSSAGPVVEAAPFQKLFKQKPKRDVRTGTIEKDADYRAFCAALQAPPPPLPSADIQADIKESEGKEEPKPQNALLDFLKERGAKRVRDSQRAAALGSSASSRGNGSRRSSGTSAGSGTTAASSAGASSSSSATAGKKSSSSSLPSSSSSGSSSSSSRPAAQSPAAASSSRGAQKATTTGSGVSVMSASYMAALEAKASAESAAAAAAPATTTKTKTTTAPVKQRGGTPETAAAKGRSSSARGGGGGGRAASKSGSSGTASPAPRILTRAKESGAKPSAEASGSSAQSSATGPASSSRGGGGSGGGNGSGDGGRRGGGSGAKGRAGGGKSSSASGGSRSKR